MRQLLADKISGSLVGIWALVPEHLRLGTWDLVCGWSGQSGETLQPRLALQLINEAALCVSHLRKSRTLSQKGFELANGLPYVVSDPAVNKTLESHSVLDALRMQTALGRIRRASGHYKGKLLAIDPHMIRTTTKRQTARCYLNGQSKPAKALQLFFCLDVDTKQVVGFTIGTSSRALKQATPQLLDLADDILQPSPDECLILADAKHYVTDIVDYIHSHSPFQFLIPVPGYKYFMKKYKTIPADQFTSRWAGYATACIPYSMRDTDAGPLYLMVQRSGEKPSEYQFNGFLTNTDCSEVDAMALHYPKRWNVEGFFNVRQALGWDRAGTLNLHIAYARMTMALAAQAATHQLRQRLGKPFADWDALHFARNVLAGLDGDVRVADDTILVTYYNAPNLGPLQSQLEHLPSRLSNENIDPRIPWLFDYKLDFRFK